MIRSRDDRAAEPAWWRIPRRNDAPCAWRGYSRGPETFRSLDDLIRARMISEAMAALLAGAVRNGSSVTVAGAESGIGKSTLLTALAAEIPPGRTVCFSRGNSDRFVGLDGVAPATATLLVSEMSPHLPVYTWGDTARRALALAVSGVQLMSTMHGQSAADVVDSLLSGLGEVPPVAVAALGVIVTLERLEPETQRPGSVVAIERLRVSSDLTAVESVRIATREQSTTSWRERPGIRPRHDVKTLSA